MIALWIGVMSVLSYRKVKPSKEQLKRYLYNYILLICRYLFVAIPSGLVITSLLVSIFTGAFVTLGTASKIRYINFCANRYSPWDDVFLFNEQLVHIHTGIRILSA